MADVVEKVARAISRRFIEANKAAGHPTNLTWRDHAADAREAIPVVANFIADDLARSYPDNANTNAFCAAIRSLGVEFGAKQ